MYLKWTFSRIGQLKISNLQMPNVITYSAQVNAVMHRCHFSEDYCLIALKRFDFNTVPHSSLSALLWTHTLLNSPHASLLFGISKSCIWLFTSPLKLWEWPWIAISCVSTLVYFCLRVFGTRGSQQRQFTTSHAGGSD